MTLAPFDGSEYRRTVLAPLRAGASAAGDDVFWLAHVPRDVDDPGLIATRLAETRAFLFKERARPRQADAAAAVLAQWPRVEAVLGDAGARRALRRRLADTATTAPADGASGVAPPIGAGPAGRRPGQVEAALGELARLRGEPELADDLFAFLGLPLGATGAMVEDRLGRIAEINRRRRPDRERSLVDELAMHCRELLVARDPAVYRASLSGGPVPPELAPGPTATERAPERGSRPVPVERVPSPPTPTPTPTPPPVAPPVGDVTALRGPDGEVRLTWTWPFGVTEAFVSVGAGSDPTSPGEGGRKVTNVKYDLDGGVALAGVPAGAEIRVHTGRRDPAGTLVWNDPAHGRGTITP